MAGVEGGLEWKVGWSGRWAAVCLSLLKVDPWPQTHSWNVWFWGRLTFAHLTCVPSWGREGLPVQTHVTAHVVSAYHAVFAQLVDCQVCHESAHVVEWFDPLNAGMQWVSQSTCLLPIGPPPPAMKLNTRHQDSKVQVVSAQITEHSHCSV